MLNKLLKQNKIINVHQHSLWGTLCVVYVFASDCVAWSMLKARLFAKASVDLKLKKWQIEIRERKIDQDLFVKGCEFYNKNLFVNFQILLVF